MSNPFQIQFTLRQHTPIIHFQHHQDGATLRASEVKPKLDKFIFEKYKSLFSEKVEHHQHLELFNPSNKSSSTYKVSIYQSEASKKYLLASNLNRTQQNLLTEGKVDFLHSMPYFAQEKEIAALFEKKEQANGQKEVIYKKEKLDEITKFGIFATKPITIKFFSLQTIVLEIISNALPYFFLYENFGTRQTKGFGCFSVASPRPTESIEDMIRNLFSISYKRTNPISGIQSQLEQIHHDYKRLKSGRGSGETGGYAKSLLFLYGVSLTNPIRWEKRQIKQKINSTPFLDGTTRIELKVENGNSAIYDGAGKQNWNDPVPFNYAYIRAMLGLAEQFEFITDQDPKFKYVVEVKSSNGIERYGSPIQFKVYDNNIYLLAEDIPNEMLDEDFVFNLRMKENKRLSSNPSFINNGFTSLKTPIKFDIADFLDFAINRSSENLENYEQL